VVIRIHLDTDLGGDTDDVRTLAMLLRWPGVELAGITTVADPRAAGPAMPPTASNSSAATTFP
jgi:inosine-uridine nucleoside N-ribohydrolase